MCICIYIYIHDQGLRRYLGGREGCKDLYYTYRATPAKGLELVAGAEPSESTWQVIDIRNGPTLPFLLFRTLKVAVCLKYCGWTNFCAPPKKPWNDDSPVHTNNRSRFPMVSKWCRIPSIHCVFKRKHITASASQERVSTRQRLERKGRPKVPSKCQETTVSPRFLRWCRMWPIQNPQ